MKKAASSANLPAVAIIYTHFPHYRAPVFNTMNESAEFNFSFYYDPRGIDWTIPSGSQEQSHFEVRTRRFGPFRWQWGAILLALKGQHDAYIFLGNPYILSTWIASLILRIRRQPILFWSHGWIKQERGLQKTIRNSFYCLSNTLLVYGNRAKQIGLENGFDHSRIDVIYNSLDYPLHARTRELIKEDQQTHKNDTNRKKSYFLSVTRLVAHVRLDLAIEAMTHMPTDVDLVIVGDGPERLSLEAMVREKKVNAIFLGAVYDERQLAELFMNAVAVVSPGKIGLLAIHSLTYGTPAITHNDFDRQMPEVEAISEGSTGGFFQFGDSVDLARVMSKYLDGQDDVNGRKALEQKAINQIKGQYTPEAQVRLISASLNRLLQNS